jgi:hypothetical protein
MLSRVPKGEDPLIWELQCRLARAGSDEAAALRISLAHVEARLRAVAAEAGEP